MKYQERKKDIILASKQIGLADAQAEQLWQALQEIQSHKKPTFSISVLLLYFGALVALLSMIWFCTSHLSSRVSLFISALYAVTFFGTGAYFWHVKKWKIPGGLLYCLGIVVVPLIVYSLQIRLHWWPTSHIEWLPAEMATLLIACLTLYFIRFPLITALIYIVVWGISIDAIQYFANPKNWWTYYSIIEMTLGTFLTGLGWILYRKSQTDFGFWSYLVGIPLAWVGLTLWDAQTEWGYFVYFLANCGLLFLSGFFHRKICIFFGSLGIIYYISYLAYRFSDSLMFSYALGAVGFLIILLAIFLLRPKKSRPAEG